MGSSGYVVSLMGQMGNNKIKKQLMHKTSQITLFKKLDYYCYNKVSIITFDVQIIYKNLDKKCFGTFCTTIKICLVT